MFSGEEEEISCFLFILVMMSCSFQLSSFQIRPKYQNTEMSLTKKVNQSHLCRTCLDENSDMTSIFVMEHILDQGILLSNMLTYFASMTIEQGDGLPENICSTCKQLIHSSYIFKIKCEESDITLRNTTNDLKNRQTGLNFNKSTSKNILQDDVNEDRSESNSSCEASNKENEKENKLDHTKKNIPLQIMNINKIEQHKQDFQSNNDHIEMCLAKDSKDKDVKNILRHKCDICCKSFKKNSNLKRHISIHSGEKPYLCNVCGKVFAQMAHLKIHSFIHTGERPYECQICNDRFSSPATLITHTRTHTGVRPHICKICGKSFLQSGYLSAHIRTHTGEKPVKCNVCNKEFNQKGSLLVHMRIHSGEKPYSCRECGKSFTVRSTLIKHTRTHTGEKPYNCKVCGQAFAQSGTLIKHMKVHQPKAT